MTLDAFITYCLTKPAVEETLPFGPNTLVMKVAGKVFALTNLEEAEFGINLKCDPQRATELRDRYPDAIIPGYHMNKKHWNTVYAGHDELGDRLVKELIDHSYALVVGGLSKRAREEAGL
jgi:predicted DNA-binding protein (MmcQ/YjbR family)